MNSRQIQGAIDKTLTVLSDKEKAWAFKVNHPSAYNALLKYMESLMDIQREQTKKGVKNEITF